MSAELVLRAVGKDRPSPWLIGGYLLSPSFHIVFLLGVSLGLNVLFL